MTANESKTETVDETVADIAMTLATHAHATQERSSGVPYIMHPAAVAASVGTPLAKAVAWLHDVLEDTTYTEEQLRQSLPAAVVDRVVLLTRRKEESYAGFIERVAKSLDEVAVLVKLADLRHNLSDLPPGPKRDKYELAELYLRNMLYAPVEAWRKVTC